MSTAGAASGRRERVRAATVEEIKSVALRLIVEEGPEAATLRAIAREMGMTAPGLYRYFASYEDLHTALVADTYERLADVLTTARDAAVAERARGAAIDPLVAGRPLVVLRLLATARAFRDWAVAHPREFILVFGTPVPPPSCVGDDPSHLSGLRFGAVFTEIFLQLWIEQPFPVADETSLPESLATQLRAYRGELAAQFGEQALRVPLTAIEVYLQAWVQLYGLVAMEVFDHLYFCLTDVGPFFDRHLLAIGRTLGIEPLTSA
jgi:AcrR family transcriptional regulator